MRSSNEKEVFLMEKTQSPVKALREKIGVSQKELADALEVHHALIANLELSVIDITEDDEETKSAINKVFSRLSEYSGIPTRQLLEQQIQTTKSQKISVKERAIGQIAMLMDKMIGSSQINSENEYYRFLEEIKIACSSDDYNLLHFYNDSEGGYLRPGVDKSPISVIREEAGITQRQYAQAANVSQTLIARIESGDLPLRGPKGEQIMHLIFESLNFPPYDDNSDDCFDPNELYATLIALQERYMVLVIQRNKDKVALAFQRLKGENEDSENIDDSETEDDSEL